MRAFGLTILYLFLSRAHISTSTIVGGMNFGTQTQRGAGTVKGGKATTDHDHFFGIVNRNRQTFDFFTQEGNSIDDAIGIITRDV